MSELIQEFDNAQQLAHWQARKLLEASPDHELLKYFVMPDEIMAADGKPDPIKHVAIQDEMKNRFWDRATPW